MYPLKLSHTPVPFTLTHRDTDTNTRAQKSLLWCYPTSSTMPRVAAFCAEWCPHPAKLAGRLTDWQAGHHPDQARPSREKVREMSWIPHLGRERGSSLPGGPNPSDRARLTGSSLGRESSPRSLPEPRGRPDDRGIRAPTALPPALHQLPSCSLSPLQPRAADLVLLLLRREKPSLCPAGWGRSHPDKEFDSSNPVVRQAVGREGAGSGLGGGLP